MSGGWFDATSCCKIARMDQILIALAGLMGAAGIMLAAAGAHGKPGVGLDSAGYLLLIHAVAVVALALRCGQGLMLRPLGLVGAVGLRRSAPACSPPTSRRAPISAAGCFPSRRPPAARS